MTKQRPRLATFSGGLVFLVAAGCGPQRVPAPSPGVTAPQETPRQASNARRGEPASSLESRVNDYWRRRQAKDLAGSYPFYCAGYRARVSAAQFLQLTRLTRFDLNDVRMTGATAEGNRTTVHIAYRFMMPTLSDQPVPGDATETWMREADGQWCKEDEPLVLPFPQGVTPGGAAPSGVSGSAPSTGTPAPASPPTFDAPPHDAPG